MDSGEKRKIFGNPCVELDDHRLPLECRLGFSDSRVPRFRADVAPSIDRRSTISDNHSSGDGEEDHSLPAG